MPSPPCLLLLFLLLLRSCSIEADRRGWGSSATAASGPSTTSSPPWANPNPNKNRPSTGVTRANRPPPPRKQQPIHYSFPAVATQSDTLEENGDPTKEHQQARPTTYSARQDTVTRLRQTHRFSLYLSCTLLGAAAGAWCGHALPFCSANATAMSIGALLWLFTAMVLRNNPTGELVRALGAAVVLSSRKFPAIRQRFPVRRYVWTALFHRHNNDRLDRSQSNTLIIMACLGVAGSFIGGSIPLLPTWLGSLVGAAVLALACISPNDAWSDVVYCMGLRIWAVVTTVGELLGGELELVPKVGAAVGQWTNTIMVWDRQHRMQERFLALVAWIQERVSNTNNEDGSDGEASGRGDRRNGPDDRRRRRRQPGQRPPMPRPGQRPPPGERRRPPPPPRDPPPPPPDSPPPPKEGYMPQSTTAAPADAVKDKKGGGGGGMFGFFRRKKQPEDTEEEDLFEGWDFGTDPMTGDFADSTSRRS